MCVINHMMILCIAIVYLRFNKDFKLESGMWRGWEVIKFVFTLDRKCENQLKNSRIRLKCV